jgi:hypothetical protein
MCEEAICRLSRRAQMRKLFQKVSNEFWIRTRCHQLSIYDKSKRRIERVDDDDDEAAVVPPSPPITTMCSIALGNRSNDRPWLNNVAATTTLSVVVAIRRGRRSGRFEIIRTLRPSRRRPEAAATAK